MNWEDYERIANLLAVEEAFAGFADNASQDNSMYAGERARSAITAMRSTQQEGE